MSKINLPKDGSVLLIDDKINEVMPLIKALYKHGIPSIYFNGSEGELPEEKLQKVRIAFLDIQLFPSADAHTYARNILQLIDRLLQEENGPYVLVIWSTTEDVNADVLEEQILGDNFGKSPIVCVRLNKLDYFNKDFDRDKMLNYLEYVEDEIGNALSHEDLELIKETTENFYQQKTHYRAKNNILSDIMSEIKTNLEDIESFHLFTQWEDLIHRSTGKVINDFSTLYESNQSWDNNIKNVFKKLAEARLGKNLKEASKKDLIKNSFRTINLSLNDQIDKDGVFKDSEINVANLKPRFVISYRANNNKVYSIRKLKHGYYTFYINGKKVIDRTKNLNSFPNSAQNEDKEYVKKTIDKFLSITPQLNTNLLIDVNPEEKIYPGNIYKKEIDGRSRRRLLKAYFDEKKISNAPISELRKINFIELEVSPICDYAQDKWLKSRILPGIFFPKRILKVKYSGSLFKSIPPIYYKGELFKLVFEFRLLKALDLDEINQLNPIIRLKKEPLSDLINHLSNHINRIGVTRIE